MQSAGKTTLDIDVYIGNHSVSLYLYFIISFGKSQVFTFPIEKRQKTVPLGTAYGYTMN
jgi:hypothetical protein